MLKQLTWKRTGIVGVGLIFGLTSLYVMADSVGPSNYLKRAGYEVESIRWNPVQFRCFDGSKNNTMRQMYSFRGSRNGIPARGYICYGGLMQAKIHPES